MACFKEVVSSETLYTAFALSYREALASRPEWPEELQALKFSANVRAMSEQIADRIKELILNKFPELRDPSGPLALLVTGSEGRLEKSCAGSMAELIVVWASSDLSGQIKFVKEKIANYIAHDGASIFSARLEEKCLETSSLYRCEVRGTKYIPTRALDARFMAGNLDLYVAYKNKLFLDLTSTTKPVKKFKKKFLKKAIDTLSNEINRKNYAAVDVETGSLISNGNEIKGPKKGLLCAIQYATAFAVFRHIPPINGVLLRSMPPTIPDRIDWLKERNFLHLSSQECDRLKNCYALGMLWYGKLQSLADLQRASKAKPVSISIEVGLLNVTLQTAYMLIMKMLA